MKEIHPKPCKSKYGITQPNLRKKKVNKRLLKALMM